MDAAGAGIAVGAGVGTTAGVVVVVVVVEDEGVEPKGVILADSIVLLLGAAVGEGTLVGPGAAAALRENNKLLPSSAKLVLDWNLIIRSL